MAESPPADLRSNSSRHSGIEHSELGELGIFPREVRDLISSCVAQTICEDAGSARPPMHYIRVQNRMRVSSQLRREFLEAFLRDGDFKEDPDEKWRIDHFLEFMHSYADVATHIRHLGIEVRVTMFTHCPGPCRAIHPYFHLHSPKMILRRAKQLRCYQDYYGIPSHRLYVSAIYVVPEVWEVPKNFLAYLLASHNNLFYSFFARVRIYMEPREAAMVALGRQCIAIQEQLYGLIDYWLRRLSKDESAREVWEHPNMWEYPNMWEPSRVALRMARGFLPQMLTDLREYHTVFVDQVLEYWHEKDEFEKYCLAEFFALAETWVD